jgi:hypothetical protein
MKILVTVAWLACAVSPIRLCGEPVKVAPLTLCEALADRLNLNGKKIAILGKLVPGDMSDGDTALVADRCPSNVVAEEISKDGAKTSVTWPSRIPLANFQPTTATLDLDRDALAQKVHALEATAERGCYERQILNRESGKWERKRWRYQWAVAYGIFTTRPDLHVTRGRPELPGFMPANGFGLMNASPAYLWLGDYTVEMIGAREPCPE